MEADPTRQLSLSLFQAIKIHCQKVSEIALQPQTPDDATLTYELRQILVRLATHRQMHEKSQNTGENGDLTAYVISTKLADYIFFPLSNLLKHPHLPDPVVRYLLEIVAFLVSHAWRHDLDESLLDQLLTLAVFLSGAGVAKEKITLADAAGKSADFVAAGTSCLVALVTCVPRNYFLDSPSIHKRLSLLGDTTTFLLDALSVIDTLQDEQMCSVLHALAHLYATRVTAEQTSFVFPGLVSKVVNFHSKSRNLSSETLLAVLDLLRKLTVRVFSDRDLGVSLTEDVEPTDLKALSAFLDTLNTAQNDSVDTSVKITLKDAQDSQSRKPHRTSAWLAATSKQYKISILVFMKNFLLGSGSRSRILANAKLAKGIFEFVSEIVRQCFRSLFNELLPSTVDILSALFYTLTEGKTGKNMEASEAETLSKIDSIFVLLPRSDLQVFLKQMFTKTGSLIRTQLKQILASANEEKICLCVCAIKVHIHLTRTLSNILLKDMEFVSILSSDLIGILSEGITTQMNREGQNTKPGAGKKQLLAFLGGVSETEPTEKNTLDEIELPPHIDAKKLGTMTEKRGFQESAANTNIARRVDLDLHSAGETPFLFGTIYSKAAETQLQSLASFVGSHYGANVESLLIHTLDNTDTSIHEGDTECAEANSLAQRSVALWLLNSVFKTSNTAGNQKLDVDFDDFLQFDESDEASAFEVNYDEESSYLLLQTAQTVLADTRALLETASFTARSKEYQICEKAYTVALETIGILASRLSKEDFQADVLMEYLYPLLEALTYMPDSSVHMQAKLSLAEIVSHHYNGSIQTLVQENADYLIDSLSMNLSVASGLTPSLPGILLVVIRISGVELLLLNQLQDILSEIFIVIDSFHGYSALVENFFHVFQEIVTKVKEIYGKELFESAIELRAADKSAYKPWGLTNRSDMLLLIDDANKLVDPFADYDREKEYFKRKPGVPFSEQAADSDDEDEDEGDDGNPETDEKEAWPSPVPKNIYSSLQQIFTYGLQLLSHPSIKLRMQILNTLKEAYVIVSSNYKILMPIIAQYWPLILGLSTGSATSDYLDGTSHVASVQADQLISPTLELMITIFSEDEKHERFMSSRFTDMWEFFKRRSPVLSSILAAGSLGKSLSREVQVQVASSKAVMRLYSQLLVGGLKTYEKSVPDLLMHEMVQACRVLGIDDAQGLSSDVKNHLWVLSHGGAHKNV